MGLVLVKGSLRLASPAPDKSSTPWPRVGMLRIQEDVLHLIRNLQPLITAIAVHDAGLARQLGRSSKSVYLNLAEGTGRRGGNRRERYETALGEIKETRAGLRLADALGYIVLDARMDDRADKIAATLWKLARPGR